MPIQILQDVKLNGALVFTDANVDFPANPEIGTVVLKDTALYAYIKLGGMETWYPFANRTNSYVHTQGLPATTWVINHNLGTTDVWTQIKDSNGFIVSATVDVIDEDNVEIRFTAAVQGTAVIVAPDSINVPEIKASLITVGANVEINTNGVLINGSYALTSANIDAQINAAVATETTARQAADATLQAALDAETTARIAADAALQTSITTNFNFEVSARQAADATLTSNLAAEVTARTAADAALQTALNNEISTRISEDNSIRNAAQTAMSAAMNAIPLAQRGEPGGVAPLNPNGQIDRVFLPSYVDDVVEFFSINNFPPEGEYSKIYVETSTNKTYRWSGSTYIQITSGAVDSVNGQVGVVVLSKADVGLGAVDNTADLDKPISYATLALLDNKQDTLISGINIKTIGGYSLMNPGDIPFKTVNGASLIGSGDVPFVSGASIIGEVRQLTSNTIPNGWLLCDGSAISRSTYALLFAAIGTAYGIGDGSTTFNLPDYRGSLGLGSGNRSGQTLTSTLGDTYTLKYGTSGPSLPETEPTNGPGVVSVNFIIAATSSAVFVDAPGILTSIDGLITTKQDTLVSNTNIKTVNGTSLLGSGNIDTTPTWSSITSKPTTISGYGITDALSSSHASDFTMHLNSAQNTWLDAITATSAEVNYLGGVTSAIQTQLNGKQATLVSNTNIKTVNGATLLGSGNVDVGGGVNGILKCNGAGAYSAVVSGTDVKTINGNSILGSGDLTITSGASVTVSDDTATNSTFYPLFGASTSGTVSAVKVSSTKFSFNPSTGQLNATIFNATSDVNAKTDIKPIENALETVKKIQGVSFAWKDTGAKSYGYIAQEIEKIVPEVVSTDEQGRKSVNYDATIAILLEAVKTLAAKVESLEK